jgi:hypothetical protein
MRYAATTYEKMHEDVCRALSCIHDNPSTCEIYAKMIIGFIMGDVLTDMLDNQKEVDVDNMGQMINHISYIKQLSSPDEDDLPF